MNIEVIEFYPIEKNDDKCFLTGTLRIKIPDLQIHVLGIFVSRRKNFWYFGLPGKKSIHHKTGEEIRYPFIVFDDPERQKELMASIRLKGREFIERRLVDRENPLTFPARQKREEGRPSQPKSENRITEVKLAPIPSIATKVWQDPPPRKISAKKTNKYARR